MDTIFNVLNVNQDNLYYLGYIYENNEQLNYRLRYLIIINHNGSVKIIIAGYNGQQKKQKKTN